MRATVLGFGARCRVLSRLQAKKTLAAALSALEAWWLSESAGGRGGAFVGGRSGLFLGGLTEPSVADLQVRVTAGGCARSLASANVLDGICSTQ